jgi:4-hydroxythreonine-4-phosphate dehydrogenase
LYRIAITSGEPAGIGPDILLKAAMREQHAQLVALADIQLLKDRADLLGLDIELKHWTGNTPLVQHTPGSLWVSEVPLKSACTPGKLNSANAEYVLELLNQATAGVQDGTFAAMVTAPVQKSVINDSGVAFSGHTEYLQEKAGVDKVVMMLASPKLRVALVTTHLPLRDVADAINEDEIEQSLRILHSDLVSKFGIASPRILVAGLNPHAGEGGHLGTEEIEIIEPVLKQLRAEGMNLVGPLPADTLFTPKYLESADAVLAMYHDQGLPVLKAQGFGESINVTLGLPFIRTSVDHGTALDLAGSGAANEESLLAAINIACQMIGSKRK